ncbi:hypothetical protein K469DRAFT_804342, partial [Zopfia rhizophila CBS 207.26]
PPSSFVAPLTPPSTDERTLTQAPRVIALFKDIEAGKHIKQILWTSFQFSQGEYDEIERRLRRDESLFGHVNDKIRHVASPTGRGTSWPCKEKNQLVICMPTAAHELFVACVEDAIHSQLKSIREEPALFQGAPGRSAKIYFPVDDTPPGT